MKPLLFVHIPKTAGTSFRIAAQKALGGRNVVCDYGESAPETTDLVKATMYGPQKDAWELYRRMCNRDQGLLSGHFPARRYVGCFGAGRTMTFLRDPVERVLSEYKHSVRHYDCKDSFREFYHRLPKINQQSKKFELVPIEAFGFVGLTERYDESLKLINRLYGTDFPSLVENVGEFSSGDSSAVTDAEAQEISDLNRNDVRLYEAGSWLISQRLDLAAQNLPFVHGRVQDVTTKRVSGWAYWEGGQDEPVEVDVRVNGEVVTRTLASRLKPTICHFGPPRCGYVGFVASISAKEGDAVDCVVRRTGQVLARKPLIVAQKRK